MLIYLAGNFKLQFLTIKLKAFNMNTQLKVGDRVRVISGNYYSSTHYKEPIASNSECYVHFLDNSDKSILLVFTNGNQHWVHNDDNFKYVEIPPTPKWLPIDRDNLPKYNVIAMKMGAGCYICALLGELTVDENGDIGVGELRTNPTHYIPLSDLLNLPISE